MHEKLERLIQAAIKKDIPVDITVPDRKEFGHYSTNLALRLAKEEKKNPMIVAGDIAQALMAQGDKGIIEKAEVAPPGFVNIWVKKEVLQTELQGIIKKKERLAQSAGGKGKKVIVEYSSVNIAKEMHVGHLRNTVLGDALANIYEATGHEVVRWNYLGDWGTQFGKVIAAYKRWSNPQEVEKAPIKTLVGLYVRFSKEAKADPLSGLAEEGSREFKKLEDGDEVNRKLWEWFRKESLKEFNVTYKRLGVDFDVWIGESFFEKEMQPLVAELLEKGIAQKSEGAIIVPLDAEGLPPAMALKSDGGSTYLTRDLANIRYRVEKYHPAKVLYVVGNEQSLHLEQVFATAKKMGVLKGTEVAHVKYGLVLGETGRKFSTREGEAVFAAEVIEKAVQLAHATVEEKRPGFTPAEKQVVAEAVAIGALKYASIRENRNSDITFDWAKVLDFSGDSGPYIQYTYARLSNILRKVGLMDRVAMAVSNGGVRELTEDVELALVRKMIELPYVVELAGRTYAPNLVTLYLYELANLANNFYETMPILKDADPRRRRGRLLLTQAVAEALKTGMKLVGMTALEKI